MKKGSIYIDSDSFFWPSDISNEYMIEQRKNISFDDETQSSDLLFEQYYLGFRSSFIVCEEKLKSEPDAIKLINKLCESCIPSAYDYTKRHLNGDFSLPVDFMWITKLKIINEIKDVYPQADSISLKLSMKPRISAYTKNNNTIVFPALLRTILNHCNLVLINNAFQSLETESKYIDRQFLSRFVLPYLLFCHDDCSVRNLPIIGGYSKEAISLALSYTNLQVMYIFAHEYAHILLKHFNLKSNYKNDQATLEKEADDFALKILLNHIKKGTNYTNEDVFTAIRWLFKYQLIEESIGNIILNKNVNYNSSTYEDRRAHFQYEFIKKCNLKNTTLIDAIGFSSIVEIQSVLNEYGIKLIDKIICAFNKSKIKGDIEPWWEMITQK